MEGEPWTRSSLARQPGRGEEAGVDGHVDLMNLLFAQRGHIRQERGTGGTGLRDCAQTAGRDEGAGGT